MNREAVTRATVREHWGENGSAEYVEIFRREIARQTAEQEKRLMPEPSEAEPRTLLMQRFADALRRWNERGPRKNPIWKHPKPPRRVKR